MIEGGREGGRERGSHEHTVRSNLAHMIGVIFFIKGKSEGENVAVSMIWTAIVEHTFRGNTLPVETANIAFVT